MVHKFDPKKAELLDSPDRIQFLDPDKILGMLQTGSEMVLADLGCGTGYFTIPASRRVKMVYALDIQQEMLDILSVKIAKGGINNIRSILSKENSIPLPDNSVDILLLVNVFHELLDRSSLLKEIKRVLSGTGDLVVIDWIKMEMDTGPPLKERLTPGEVISICQNNGFRIKKQLESGPYNYLLVFGGKRNARKKEKERER